MSKWEIEISSEASEEEIIEALSKEIDFDEVRENINKLKKLNNKYGSFKRIEKVTDGIDPLKIWTEYFNAFHGYSWITNGKKKGKDSNHEIVTYFTSENPFTSTDEIIICDTEYVINLLDPDSESNDYVENYRVINLWDFIEISEITDNFILENMSW